MLERFVQIGSRVITSATQDPYQTRRSSPAESLNAGWRVISGEGEGLGGADGQQQIAAPGPGRPPAVGVACLRSPDSTIILAQQEEDIQIPRLRPGRGP